MTIELNKLQNVWLYIYTISYQITEFRINCAPPTTLYLIATKLFKRGGGIPSFTLDLCFNCLIPHACLVTCYNIQGKTYLLSCYFLDQVAVVNSKRAELDSVRKELGQAEENLEIKGGSVPSTTPFSTTNSGSGKSY